jgi:hypothetical protein
MSSSKLALALIAAPLFAQAPLTTIQHDSSNPYKSPIDGEDFRGTIRVKPKCPTMVRGGKTYGMGEKLYCVGITGGACSGTPTAAGIVTIQLLPTGSGTTPEGCYYTAEFNPKTVTGNSLNYTLTWTVPASETPISFKDLGVPLSPNPSARWKVSQVDTDPLPAGCATIANGGIGSTGVACPSVNPIPLYSATFTTTCASVPVGVHGFTNGGLTAWATDNSTGEILRPSVNTNIGTTRTVEACFANGVAPASWTLNIAGAPGSGLPKYDLLSSDQTIPASQHGIHSLQAIGACFDASGLEFECLITFDPVTFAARIQHTPFLGGAYAVLLGR